MSLLGIPVGAESGVSNDGSETVWRDLQIWIPDFASSAATQMATIHVFKRRGYYVLLIQIRLSYVRAVSDCSHLGCEKGREFSFLAGSPIRPGDFRPLSGPIRHNGLETC